jgi:phage tail sheath protein FI
MAKSASPAVTTTEIDLTSVVPSVQSSTGAMVGNFRWGPVDQPVLVGNEGVLAETFGNPADDTTAVDFVSAKQFLTYASTLYVTRSVTSAATNATANQDAQSTALLIKNNAAYAAAISSFGSDSPSQDTGMFLAKYPGALGNGIQVSVFPAIDGDAAAQATAFGNWTTGASAGFPSSPGTSAWAKTQNSATNDEVHVLVIDRDGKFSGTVGAILETYAYLSVAKGAKTTDGGTNYLPDVINSASEYVRFGYWDILTYKIVGTNWGQSPDLPSAGGTNFGSGTEFTPSTGNADALISLSGGVDSGALEDSDILLTNQVYADPESIVVDFLIAPGMANTVDHKAVVGDLVSIATSRKDCVVVASPSRAAVVNNADPVTATITEANAIAASSYLFMENNYIKVLDKHNGRYIFIPAASTTAGIMAASDLGQGPWFSPAGQKRGQYFGVVGLSYSATKTQRDLLYNAGINPIVNLPGRGIMLFGDKTKESRPSAFDRINVRRLFLVVERAISLAARNVMFEFNDEFTRAEFVNIIEPFLREIKGRRGITDFYVQCDVTNNTPAVVDRNELIATVFIKPARSINFITLNFVAVRTGVDFEEVVGTV